MIARMWRSRVRAADAQAYRHYVNSTWARDFRAARGNRGTFFFHRVNGDVADVVTLSFWDSFDDLKSLLGDAVDVPGYYPDDQRFLLDFPKFVEHFELDVTPDPS